MQPQRSAKQEITLRCCSLSCAVCLQRPPPAGIMAAAAVLLAGALASSLSRRQREASVLAQQQQLMLKQRAEELRAQKAVSAQGPESAFRAGPVPTVKQNASSHTCLLQQLPDSLFK